MVIVVINQSEACMAKNPTSISWFLFTAMGHPLPIHWGILDDRVHGNTINAGGDFRVERLRDLDGWQQNPEATINGGFLLLVKATGYSYIKKTH